MRTRRSWLVLIAVSAIAAAATVDAVLGRSSRQAPDASPRRGESTTAPTTTASTTSSLTINAETSSPLTRRCRERQLDLRSFTGEPTAVLAQVRGPDCRQPPIRIKVRITSATGARGKGTLFGPEPPAFGGVFAAGSTQVAAFRYSPACRGEGPPFRAYVTAGSYDEAFFLATVERCGEVFAADPSRPCTETSGTGRWVSSCEGKWVRAFVRAAGFRIVDESGSAWIARGRGSSFYIWGVPIADSGGLWDEGYRRVAGVRGKGLYSDGIRFTWAARGGRVWVEPGPDPSEPDPGRAVLAPLVRASVSVQPPGS